jgi:hypothetical protein
MTSVRPRKFWKTGEGLNYLQAMERGDATKEEVAEALGVTVNAVDQAYRAYLRSVGRYVPRKVVRRRASPTAQARSPLERLVQAAIEYAGEEVAAQLRRKEEEIRRLTGRVKQLEALVAQLQAQAAEAQAELERKAQQWAQEVMTKAGAVSGD